MPANTPTRRAAGALKPPPGRDSERTSLPNRAAECAEPHATPIKRRIDDPGAKDRHPGAARVWNRVRPKAKGQR